MNEISSYNWLTNSELLLNNLHTKADLFRFLHTINDENTYEVFSIDISAMAWKNSRH